MRPYRRLVFVQQPAETTEHKPGICGRPAFLNKKQTGELLAKIYAHIYCPIMHQYGSKICPLLANLVANYVIMCMHFYTWHMLAFSWHAPGFLISLLCRYVRMCVYLCVCVCVCVSTSEAINS